MSEHTALDRLNALQHERAVDTFAQCCAARAWAETMAAGRPYRDAAALFGAADRAWRDAGPATWRAAFAGHPRLGERKAAAATTATEQRWSAEEQAGVRAADDDAAAQLAAAQQEYEARFGHIFLICAAGRSAAEMLDNLRARLGNDADTELRVAAEEQRRITRLRLERMLA